PEEIERIRALAPDLLVVAAYGQLLPPALLASAARGAINLHYSLLPRHRGASPIQAAILAGDRETGVSVMWMTEGLDEGPVLLARRVAIDAEDDAESLGLKLAHVAAECLVEALDRIERGDAPRVVQDPALATYAPKMSNDAGRLSFRAPAEEVARRVRAFTPHPGAYVDALKGRLQILSGSADAGADAEPGSVLAIERDRGVRVAANPGSIWLRKVKPSGRREMSGFDYANGARLKPGDRVDAVSATA
ncbi:MAG: methionyl-tRNA formyltransferase, partial [Candidatus Eiseniibacteriota bacterium]